MSRVRAAVPLISITALGALFAVITLNGVALSASDDSDSETQGGDHVKVLATAFTVSRTADTLAATGAVASNGKMTRGERAGIEDVHRQ